MGQKVNPHGARVGVIKDWNTRWYADKKNFADNLVSDAKLRKMIKELEFVDDKSKKPVKLYDAGISSIEIERRFDNEKARVTVTLNVAKPGIVIGANGANIEKIKAAIVKELGAQNAQVILNVQEIKNPDLDAQLVAENIAAQQRGCPSRTQFFTYISGQVLVSGHKRVRRFGQTKDCAGQLISKHIFSFAG